MSVEKKKQMGVLGLVVVLVVLLLGSVLFAGAVSGWFDGVGVTLDPEYLGEGGMVELAADDYEGLVGAQKSFVVFVDQGGCTTADRLREYVSNWANEKGIKVQRMMFADMKETSMHEKVKYYPSVVVVSKGEVVGFLRADAEEDAEAYNNYEAFKGWIGRYL